MGVNKQIEWRRPDEIIRPAEREREGPAGKRQGEDTQRRGGEMNICPRVSRGTAPTWRDESLKITAISTLCLDEPL